MILRYLFILLFYISLPTLAATDASISSNTLATHDDFRIASDAYIARNGTMMLRKVQDAVDKKNNDGLMLFLRMMGDDEAASSYNPVTHETDSTLREILSKPQWNELRELLVQATDTSSIDDQYALRVSSQFKYDFCREYLKQHSDTTSVNALITDDSPLTNKDCSEANRETTKAYIQRGSKRAMRMSDDIILRAETGDPHSQLQLGLKYLNSKYGDEGCSSSQDLLCKTRDETKGYYWLKQAAKSYDQSFADMDVFSYEMCQVLRENAKGDKEALRQAYLWAFVGINYTVHKSQACLMNMLKAGELKRIDPELANVWGIRSGRGDEERLNLTYQARPLPTWLSDARNEIKYKQSPIFTISATSPVYYGFSVFEDGRVTSFSQDIVLMQVSPDTVKAFMAELRNMGFWDWNFRDLSFDYFGMCEYTCPKITSVQVMTRNGKEVKRLLLESASLYPKNIITQRMAKLVLLSEKYFPYTSKVCGFAKSEYFKQACKEPPFAVWRKILEEK